MDIKETIDALEKSVGEMEKTVRFHKFLKEARDLKEVLRDPYITMEKLPVGSRKHESPHESAIDYVLAGNACLREAKKHHARGEPCDRQLDTAILAYKVAFREGLEGPSPIGDGIITVKHPEILERVSKEIKRIGHFVAKENPIWLCEDYFGVIGNVRSALHNVARYSPGTDTDSLEKLGLMDMARLK